jgi:hypothetical protein
MPFENTLALIIGIGQYAHVRRLAKAANDAQSIQQLLTDPSLCGYEPANVLCLLDEHADKKTIQNGLDWLAAQTQPDSTVLIFFAGHGEQDPGEPITGNYLLPYDCDPFENGRPDIHKLAQTSISSEGFTRALTAIESQKLVVIFDCCHAGGVGVISRDPFGYTEQMRAGLSENYYELLAQGQGRLILASCLAHESSWERSDMANGIFTAQLLTALRGRSAVRGDGLIRILDVFHDLSVWVPLDAARCYDPQADGPAQQHPLLKAVVQDNFPIALHQGDTGSIPSSMTEQHLQIRSISEIRSLITNHPIEGTEKLITYLSDKPKWNTARQALGVRLADLKRAAQQRYDIGMIEPALEIAQRLAIHFALSVCWEIEDNMRSNPTG